MRIPRLVMEGGANTVVADAARKLASAAPDARMLRLPEPRMRVWFALLALAATVCGSARAPATTGPAAGRLSGVVVDKETARPIPNVQVAILGTAIRGVTDLDGRYRTDGVPAGLYSIRVFRIGYRPLRVDSVVVRADEATALDLTIEAAPASFSGMGVTAERVQRTSSESGLLALREKAAVPLFSRLRLAGRARHADWSPRLDSDPRVKPLGVPVERDNADLLWSANATLSLTDRMNLRVSSFTSVTRPNGRELFEDYYVPVVGDCTQQGSPTLERARVLKGDVRWEWFPAPDNLVSLGGFYKHIDKPIVELLDIVAGATCREQATNYGGEVQLRHRLSFLPGALHRLFLSVHATWVTSRVSFDTALTTLLPVAPLEKQSPFIASASLSYATPSPRLNASILYNWIADHITRYGVASVGGAAAPNVVERGRESLDDKLQRGLGRRLIFTLSGRSLLNQNVIYYQEFEGQRLTHVFYRPGVSITAGVGVDF